MNGSRKTFTLLQLNKSIRNYIAEINKRFWVTAEIARVQQKNGHFYLELVQKEDEQLVAQMRANMWRSTHQALIQKIGEEEFYWIVEEGKEVLIQVEVTFHEIYGISLQVSDLDLAYTIGEMALRKQLNLKRLQEEGFMQLQKQLNLPQVIQRIAVISSQNAAGLKDFSDQLEQNAYGYSFHVTLFDATVQGKNAIDEIQKQLLKISSDEFDAIALIRGGGAKSDLEIFNHYELSKVVAQAQLPIFTGIGHQIDETIVDLIAYKALKTPTAVATFFIEYMLSFEEKLWRSMEAIERTIHYRITEEKQGIEKLQSNIRYQSVQLLRNQSFNLKNIQSSLQLKGQHLVQLEEEKLKTIAWKIKEMDPRALFKKGYSLSLLNNQKMQEKTEIKVGDQLKTYLSDKIIYSTIEKYEKH